MEKKDMKKKDMYILKLDVNAYYDYAYNIVKRNMVKVIKEKYKNNTSMKPIINHIINDISK